ncbi:MAG: hypothetical protein U0326_23700 [Polyangiales bacterium]
MKNAAVAQSAAIRTAQPLVGAPANEAQAGPPPITLTDAQKKRLAAQAAALDAGTLLPLPAYLGERLTWMAKIQATAWRDRAEFGQVADEDEPIRERDIEDFGHRIEFARDVEADRTLAVATHGTDVTKMTEGALWTEMLAHRTTLCAALELRFAKDPPLRETVAAIRGVTRKVDVTRALRQLLRVFEDDALAAWVAKLPKGEGPALARLRALHPEWVRRSAHGAVTPVTAASDDLMRRAYTLAVAPMERVLRVGRYLTRDIEERKGDYRAFRAPPPRKVAPKDDATKKPPVTDPSGKPTG